MHKTVKNFIPQGGKHCITNSLKQIFACYGYPLSEAMIFGLASGLSFLYLNQAACPMVNGRTKVFDFEKKLAERLNIIIKCKSGSDYTKIFQAAKNMIDQDVPVLVYVDMPYLQYLGLDKNSHFGGHGVVLFGYDDDSQQFFVSDRDNHDFPIMTPLGNISEDYHLISYSETEKARSSCHKPFPAKNKYLVFDFSGYREIDKADLSGAIQETCATMLHPPAKLLGVEGIRKFYKEILKWKKFDTEKIKLAAITNYFQISQHGGTGGGIFRKMYGEFLLEAAPIMDNENIAQTGRQFIETAKQWDNIADSLRQLSLDGDTALLPAMSDLIMDIYHQEVKLYQSLDSLTGKNHP